MTAVNYCRIFAIYFKREPYEKGWHKELVVFKHEITSSLIKLLKPSLQPLGTGIIIF